MLVPKQTFLLLGSLFSTVIAIQKADVHVPGITMPETEEGLLLIHFEAVNTPINGKSQPGVLAFYVDADPNDPTFPLTTSPNHDKSPLSKRVCGSNDVSCFSSYRANTAVCSSLIYQLELSSANVPYSPRSLCLISGACGCDTCCVSWANPVPWGTAQKFELANAAYKTLDQCSGSSGVSGLTRNTLIGNTCTTQCLSGRSNGCE